MGLLKAVQGTLVLMWFELTLVLGSMAAGVVLFPLLLTSPRRFRFVFDRLVLGTWIKSIAAITELLLGVKIVISGDKMTSRDRALIVMNHRCRLDWLFLWSVFVRQSEPGAWKAVLKSSFKKIPGVGWANQMTHCVFIGRRWETDKLILTKGIEYFHDVDYNAQILLFPEGTTFSSKRRIKNDEFARKNNLTPYEYVLHPRTTGFTFLVDQMRRCSHLDAVYDMTIGFPDACPVNEIDIAKGIIPKEIHFHVKRYDVTTLPQTEEGLQTWCKERWREKEERLKQFYQDKRFSSPSEAPTTGDSSAAGGDKNPALEIALALLGWVAYTVIFLYLIAYVTAVRYFAILCVTVIVFITHFYGGYDRLQARYTAWYYQHDVNANKKK